MRLNILISNEDMPENQDEARNSPYFVWVRPGFSTQVFLNNATEIFDFPCNEYLCAYSAQLSDNSKPTRAVISLWKYAHCTQTRQFMDHS